MGGSAKARERHRGRGKLLPRERIDRLLDEGSDFLEIAPLAANGLYQSLGFQQRETNVYRYDLES